MWSLTPEKLKAIKKYAIRKDKPLYYEIEELEERMLISKMVNED